MNTEDFVKIVKRQVVEDSIVRYEDMLNMMQAGEATDPYWIDMLDMYHSLSLKHKQTLLAIMRQTSIDSISSIFAIFDGKSFFESDSKEFRISYGDTVWDNDLQDCFLALFED